MVLGGFAPCRRRRSTAVPGGGNEKVCILLVQQIISIERAPSFSLIRLGSIANRGTASAVTIGHCSNSELDEVAR